LAADVRFDVAIASAVNLWLVETFFDSQPGDPTFRGSIRVAPRDVRAAVKEIEKWGSDSRFVQVAVTLEAIAPYGQETYFPIWEAAASFGLPILVCADNSRGVGPGLSPIGYPTHYLEVLTLGPFAGAAHLVSLICSGVFERLESVVFVFGDGAFDLIAPLLWRTTKDWMALRSELPWIVRPPLEYLSGHARFILHSSDGPLDPSDFDRFLELTHLSSTLLYGSGYPRWDHFTLQAAQSRVPLHYQDHVFGGAAAELYTRMIHKAMP
jgi:predicted TIM-barrel fold metal-dependent hydrolase